MIRKPISYRSEVILTISSIVGIIAFYAFLSYRQHQANPADTTIPNLNQLIEGCKSLIKTRPSGSCWLIADCFATLTRLFLGLLTGVVLSVLVGVAMGVNYYVEGLLKYPIVVFSKIPPTAMLALYFVIFGIDLSMYVSMVALGIFPSLVMAIFSSVRSDVYDYEIYKAYTLGLSNMEVILEVVFQKILPRIIEGIRQSVGPALVFLVAAEWMMADVGFGYRIRTQSRLLNMNVVYACLAILGFLGVLLDWGLALAKRTFCRWFDFAKN